MVRHQKKKKKLQRSGNDMNPLSEAGLRETPLKGDGTPNNIGHINPG